MVRATAAVHTSRGKKGLAIAGLVIIFLSISCGPGTQDVATPSEALTLPSPEEGSPGLEEAAWSLARLGKEQGARRLEFINASVWPTLRAVPKNFLGRLGPRAVRHTVSSYFAKEHGLLIRGLEVQGLRKSSSRAISEVPALQRLAKPVVKALLKARQAEYGLSTNDVVLVLVALEYVIFSHSASSLKVAYALNNISTTEYITEEEAHEVLLTFLVISWHGSSHEFLEDRSFYNKVKNAELAKNETWKSIVDFERDFLFNNEFRKRGRRTPFQPPLFSNRDMREVVNDMLLNFGKLQQLTCTTMKDMLARMDPRLSGRVPLRLFYSRSPEQSVHFQESSGYLRATGTLEEMNDGMDRVIIVNYMLSPSNCIASGSATGAAKSNVDWSLCCLNECESIMVEIEREILAPTATVDQLLQVARDIVGKRGILPELVERLKGIAAQHGGKVPLHGRLFQQWMHFVFPYACPYPHANLQQSALSAARWLREPITASQDEVKSYVKRKPVDKNDKYVRAPALDYWSDEEVLPLEDGAAQAATPDGATEEPSNSWTKLFSVLVGIALVLPALLEVFSRCLAPRAEKTNGADCPSDVPANRRRQVQKQQAPQREPTQAVKKKAHVQALAAQDQKVKQSTPAKALAKKAQTPKPQLSKPSLKVDLDSASVRPVEPPEEVEAEEQQVEEQAVEMEESPEVLPKAEPEKVKAVLPHVQQAPTPEREVKDVRAGDAAAGGDDRAATMQHQHQSYEADLAAGVGSDSSSSPEPQPEDAAVVAPAGHEKEALKEKKGLAPPPARERVVSIDPSPCPSEGYSDDGALVCDDRMGPKSTGTTTCSLPPGLAPLGQWETPRSTPDFEPMASLGTIGMSPSGPTSALSWPPGLPPGLPPPELSPPPQPYQMGTRAESMTVEPLEPQPTEPQVRSSAGKKDGKKSNKIHAKEASPAHGEAAAGGPSLSGSLSAALDLFGRAPSDANEASSQRSDVKSLVQNAPQQQPPPPPPPGFAAASSLPPPSAPPPPPPRRRQA